MDNLLNALGFYCYALAFVASLARVMQPRLTRKVPLAFIGLGAALQLAGFVYRWTVIHWAPVTTEHEIYCYLALGLAVAMLLTFRKFDAPVLTALSLILPIAVLGVAIFQKSAEYKPVVPGLQSNWMPI
ncbi:MAG: hypothetical protein JO317_08240, partial [Verrucomicrobiae bacterium]|nr:hypothetical protein [Verrucomicrobiae bacterium]